MGHLVQDIQLHNTTETVEFHLLTWKKITGMHREPLQNVEEIQEEAHFNQGPWQQA